MSAYVIKKLRGNLEAGSELVSSVWDNAMVANLDCFPWYKNGEKHATQARVLNDGENLHILFVAQDTHISAVERTVNDNVCIDSCVEFFASPWGGTKPGYFNLEINCCGQVLLHYGTAISNTLNKVKPEDVAQLSIKATFAGKSKAESAADKEWRIYAKLSRAFLSMHCGADVSFSGSWTGNFYRCGGQTNQQYACWHKLPGERPNFHQPEGFGPIVFE